MTTATKSATPTKAELKAKLATLAADLEKARATQEEEMSKDWLEYAKDVTEKFFGGYPKVEAFLDRCVTQMTKRFWVISPLGRRRTMYRGLTGNNRFIADAGRRAKNSPIQGISSEAGVTAGYLILQHIHKYMLTFGIDMKLFSLYCRAVHDASYFEEAYRMVIPALHINQWVATQGITDYYEETFGFKFILSPEIEIEYGADAKNGYAWNWDLEVFPVLLLKVLCDLAKAGRIDEAKIPKIHKAMMHPWCDKEQRTWLQAHYPLLGVENLEKQIVHSVTYAWTTKGWDAIMATYKGALDLEDIPASVLAAIRDIDYKVER